MIRTHGLRTAWVLALALLSTGSFAADGAGRAMTLGPGELDALPIVAAACPTFHWAEVNGEDADAVELLISRLIERGEDLEMRPVLDRRLPGQTRIWTPYAGECLEPGAFYAWSVRPIGGDGEAGAWSRARYFQVHERAAQPAGGSGAAAPAIDGDGERAAAEGPLPIGAREPPEARAGARPRSGAASDGGERVRPSGTRSRTVGRAAARSREPAALTPAVGAASGEGALTVSGGVAADEFRYRTPASRTHPVPAVAFRPGGLTPSDSVRYGNGYSCLAPSSSESQYLAFAEVHLPDGAVIDSFTCSAYDDDPSADGIWRYELKIQEYGATFVFSPWEITIDSSGNDDEALSSTATSVSPITVDNSEIMLFASVSYERDVGSQNSLNLLNLGCKIDYSLAAVSTP